MGKDDELILRLERPDDIDDIGKVIQLAFANSPYGDQQEHLIVHKLRQAGALSLSLIAIISNRIVGFAGTSPVGISDHSNDWYGLGPVAVLPDLCGKGIGSMLVEEILHRLQLSGAAGCVVLGDPDYYRRFGFSPDDSLSFADFDPELFQSIRFNDTFAHGDVSYHAAFYS